jgi:hypothetical protein
MRHAREVFAAPDGTLGLIPFDTLPLNKTELLLDRYQISNVGSGRDLVRLLDRTAPPLSPCAIFCAPDFDATHTGELST